MDQPEVRVTVDFKEALKQAEFLGEHFSNEVKNSFLKADWRRWLDQRITVVSEENSTPFHSMVMLEKPDGELYVKVFWKGGQFTYARWELSVFYAALKQLIERNTALLAYWTP